MARTSFTKPIIVISKCLNQAACRWDGDCLRYPFVRALRRYALLVPVCPEMEIGLGCPREKIWIFDRDGRLSLEQPATGRKLTKAMRSFARHHIRSLAEAEGFLLKSKSPSCGIRDTKRFDNGNSPRIVGRGPGLYAAQALKSFPEAAVEDEIRLENPRVREHWLTRLYVLAAFRSLRKRPSVGRLETFHNRNVVLFAAYNRKRTGGLKRVMALLSEEPLEDVLERYETNLHLILKRPARPKAMVEAMSPAYEHYAGHLDKAERRAYRKLVEECASGEAPVNEIRKLIQVWAVRYDKDFTREHSLYRPYPGPLAQE
ncbi:MAG: DUF1722 domain-containing protein [bacterium]|nr:DUF1722 domain-containing protein [bacterium]